MAYVVAEPCIKCKHTDCVTVCPVDCFHEGTNYIAIDPVTCIDCGACVPECPVNAIFAEAELPEKWAEYKQLNERLARAWPSLLVRRKPLPEAERFKDVEDKRQLLDESGPS
jgi:ferredoxin